MQGRLSPQVDGKIQAFPRVHWRNEFPAASRLGLGLLEWTLDHDGLHDNPMMTREGRLEIQTLAELHSVRVSALTGDLFMQAPFWKSSRAERAMRVAELDAVGLVTHGLPPRFVEPCSSIRVTYRRAPSWVSC